MICLFLLVVGNLAVQSKGILVILKNYKSFCAKGTEIGSDFNFVKGLLANILLIIILVAILHFSPKYYNFAFKIFFP